MCPSGWLHGRCNTGIVRGDPLQPQFSLVIMGISLDQWRVSIGLFHCCTIGSSQTLIIRCSLIHLLWSLLAKLTPIFKWAYLVSQQQLESSLCNFQFSLVMFLLLLEAGDIESIPGPDNEHSLSILGAYEIKLATYKLNFLILMLYVFLRLILTKIYLLNCFVSRIFLVILLGKTGICMKVDCSCISVPTSYIDVDLI